LRGFDPNEIDPKQLGLADNARQRDQTLEKGVTTYSVTHGSCSITPTKNPGVANNTTGFYFYQKAISEISGATGQNL